MAKLTRCFALLAAALFLVGSLQVTAFAASEEATYPVIALTDVPPYGVKRPIQGQVFMEDGSDFDSADYRVAIFLQVTENGSYWVKPYYDKPYTELGGDGAFTGVFVTGGEDNKARVLHVMLVPGDYTPQSFASTKAVALDYVKITRTEEGDVLVVPEREAPGPTVPAIDALLPVAGDKLAVDIGFYTDGSAPGSPLSESQIRAQLEAVSRFADTVRFYGSADELYKAYKIAHDMGFSVVGTAWLSGNDEADKKEMDALIAHCNNGYVQVACVGNETLLRGDLTAKELIEDISYVRNSLSDASIPVTTSDSVDILIENASLRNACNLIMPNCYPYWGGVGISEAESSFIESITNLQAASGRKQVLVSETGWPTAGQTKGEAVPSEEAAAAYFDAIRRWSLATGTQVLWFEAADEPWKSSAEGGAGAHWGFLSSDFDLKEGYATTEFFRTNPIPKLVSALRIEGIVAKTYTGTPQTQAIVVMDGEDVLTEGVDYTLSYPNNTNAGTATLTITGKGGYTGTKEMTFTIAPADLAPATVATIPDQAYTGSAVEPALSVSLAGRALTAGTDYTTSYADNVEVGTARVTVTGRGNYAGTVSAMFEIVEPTRPFFLDADPADDDNHGAEVDWMGRVGISTGWEVAGGREYRGMRNVTRCDFAAFLYRMADLSDDGKRNDSVALTDAEVESTLAGVSDCDGGTYHAAEVAWIIRSGISMGWENGDGSVSFRPMAEVARQDMAAFLYRFADLDDNGEQDQPLAMGTESVSFSDVRHGDSANHAAEVEWLASVGVTRGWDMGDGTYRFRGTRTVARQDMAAFMKRLYDYLG